jgi:hypothetical protein
MCTRVKKLRIVFHGEFCDNGYETTGSIKHGISWLVKRNCQLLKKDPVPSFLQLYKRNCHSLDDSFRQRIVAEPVLESLLLLKFQLIQFSLRAVIAQSVQRWATGWTIGVLEFDSRRGLGIFLFTTASRTALGPTQPPIQWVPGALSLGVKWPGREADHSPPSSAEVKE